MEQKTAYKKIKSLKDSCFMIKVKKMNGKQCMGNELICM